MNYKEYWKEQVNFQLTWREDQANFPKENGFQNGNEYPHIIPKAEWAKTIWDQFKENLLEYLKKEKIQHHTGSHNLLSSWVLCSNLYYGTFFNDNFKELFRKFLEDKLKENIGKIEDIQLELVLGGGLNPKNLLGEPGGVRGTRQTTPDLGVIFITNGKKGLILVECKYTEHSFYDCSGAKAKNTPDNKCKIKETMKNIEKNCFLNEWGRKYWNYLQISEYGQNKLKFCPAFLGAFQIVRQQALAEGLLKIGNYENVWSCIAYDGRNEGLMESMKRNGINLINNEWEKIFDLKTKFTIWEHQEWVEYVRKNGIGIFEKEWEKYIKNRYNM